MTACRPISASPVADQRARGKEIYQQGCATETCHGVNGEGIRIGDEFRDWPLIGEEFQRRNPSAQVVFEVVRSGGEPALRALTDQQVYDAIAYELSLNQVELAEPLGSQNAPVTPSGAAAGAQKPGSLFPPPGNASLISKWPAPALPAQVESRDLRLRLTQIALAESIGGAAPPGGGSYALVVFTLEALAGQPLQVGPQHLRLVTGEGQTLEPLEIGLDYPVTRFYPQSIQPEHGTAALAIFALPDSTGIISLNYTLPGKQPLILELIP
ncbi:MAG: cytochrome c [Chloroflexota bacterium]